MATEPILAALVVVHAPIVHRGRAVHSTVMANFWAPTNTEINFLIATAATGFCLGPSYSTRTFPMGLVRGHTPRHTTSAVREYYITIPIDDNIVKCYATCGSANVRLQDREFASELIWRIPITIHATRLDYVQCSNSAIL